MTDSKAHDGSSVWAAVAVVAGPGAALLHEAGVWSFGPEATLWPIGFVAAAAACGVAVGLRIVRRGSRLLGLVTALPNVAVLAFYGFFLLFFGLGGSR